MGIIIKQSIKGSIWSYLGVGIGFVTTAYLYPKFLEPDVIGLFGLLMAWSVLAAQFSSLGFSGVTSRLFPYFRDNGKGHHGFLAILGIVIMLGFTLFLLTYILFAPHLIESNTEKSRLFSDYIHLLIPITFFTLLFNQLDAYNRLLYNAVYGTFLVEFLQRLLLLFIVVIYVFNLISLSSLIVTFAGVVSIKGLLILFHLLKRGEINLKLQLSFLNKKLRKEMVNVAFFSILSNVGGHALFSLDKILINQLLDLSSTGVYTIASFFGTIILIPSRPLQRISGTLVAEAWKDNKQSYINDIYKRTSLNQLIIGLLLFGIIWLNVDNIITFLGSEYEDGRGVILFVGIGVLINMIAGGSTIIIAYSKYFKIAPFFLLFQIIIFVGSVYFLIPRLGITGAGIGLAVSYLFVNVLRYVFLYKKFKMQPYSTNHFYVVVLFLIVYLLTSLIPQMSLIFDILVRGTIFLIGFIGLIVVTKISHDITQLVKKFLQRK